MSRFNGKRGRFSRFSLSTSITPAPSYPVVTGGTLFDGGIYYYRAFTTSDVLTVSDGSLDAEALVIGGGGGSGYASGGGAGGVLIQSLTLQPGNYTATVGAGGAINNYYANPGANSSFASITALGGSGQTIDGQSPAYGGSGAGGMGNDATFGYGTPGQGFNGGSHAFRSGGGGGGAAGAGGSAGNYVGANGGPAILLQDWASATALGVDGYFAGGGGGSGQYGNGAGGGGGAGNGGSSSSAAATAVANTGSGAGSRYGWPGGAAGSGVIIVRYLKSQVEDFVPYPAVQSGNQISFISWREANNQPNNGFPGRYYYSDGTQLFQGQTAVVQGSSTPHTATWGNGGYTLQPDGWYQPSNMSFAELWDNVRFDYATSVNIVPNYICPGGGTYNSVTGMCE